MPPPAAQVVAVPFVPGCVSLDGGDLRRMVDCDEFADTLFVHFGTVLDDIDHVELSDRTALANLRPGTSSDLPHASSVPIGWSNVVKFECLSGLVRMCIDVSIERIVCLARLRRCARVAYPCGPTRDCCAQELQDLGNDVVGYIVSSLQQLSDRLDHGECIPWNVLRDNWKTWIVDFAWQVHSAATTPSERGDAPAPVAFDSSSLSNLIQKARQVDDANRTARAAMPSQS